MIAHAHPSSAFFLHFLSLINFISPPEQTDFLLMRRLQLEFGRHSISLWIKDVAREARCDIRDAFFRSSLVVI
jgi:hypothetical protein